MIFIPTESVGYTTKSMKVCICPKCNRKVWGNKILPENQNKYRTICCSQIVGG
jgi:hypothetical protein